MWWGGVVGAGVRKLLARYFTYVHTLFSECNYTMQMNREEKQLLRQGEGPRQMYKKAKPKPERTEIPVNLLGHQRPFYGQGET